MLRELHKSLICHIKPLVNDIMDYYGNVLDVPVLIKHPHMNLKTESYPCITIQFLNSDENLQYTDVNSYKVVPSATLGMVDIMSEPTIYDFNFQLDVWAKDPITRDAIVGSLMFNLPKRGLINIEYSDLESLPCNYTCGRLITTDYVNNHNETIFRNTLDIKLQTPIFNQEIVTTVIVEDINININNKEDK